MLFRTWGHFISDSICRLWFLQSDAFKNHFKNCPLVCLLGRSTESCFRDYQSYKRLLEILEVDFDKILPITQPTQFEKIIVPDVSFTLRNFTAQYRETIDRIRHFALKNRTPISNKKIYYFHGIRQLGEERLAEYFKAKGYEIVRPEKLTLDEQLNLLINCESFASPLGSISHNSVFLRDGTEAIFVVRSLSDLSNSYQQTLNQVNSIKANYIDSSLQLFGSFAGSYCYIISEQLKRFFGDKWDGYEEDDFKFFLQHIKDSLRRNIEFIPNARKYYGSVLEDFMAQLKRREDLIVSCDMPPRWETFQPSLRYSTHVNKTGWGAWRRENQVCGTLEQRDIQAIKVDYPKHKVYYSVYYNDKEGWSAEVTNGEQAGTTGKGKPIYGMRIRLDEAGAKEFDLLYRMHKFDGTWTPWAKNGEAIYSHGQKLSAIQIKLEPINSAETDTKKFDYTQTFWLKDDEIYLQGQRPQIN